MPAAGRPATGCKTVEGPTGTELVMAAADTAVAASVNAGFTAFERIDGGLAGAADPLALRAVGRAAQARYARRRTGTAATSRFYVNRVAFDQLGAGARQGCSTRSTRASSCRPSRSTCVIAAGRDALRANPIFRDFLAGVGGAPAADRLPRKPQSVPVASRAGRGQPAAGTPATAYTDARGPAR